MTYRAALHHKIDRRFAYGSPQTPLVNGWQVGSRLGHARISRNAESMCIQAPPSQCQSCPVT